MRFQRDKTWKKSLLIDGTWFKNGDNTSFGVTIRDFNEAAICKLVDLYLSDKLSNLIRKKT